MKKILIVGVPDDHRPSDLRVLSIRGDGNYLKFTVFTPPTDEEIMDIAIINSNSVAEAACFMNGEKYILSLLK